ncbi:MAG: carotenoid biosynthesis protein [Chloroflexota bacterium]
MQFLSVVLETIILRPYVFVFLLVYLIGCSMHLGIKRALLFAAAGYLIAWLSEYSSINNGIPYGHYYYIEQTKDKEIWVLGVPFMDSLSYVFLAYASYAMALMVISPALLSGGAIYLLETREIRKSLLARMLGTLFFVYLDIIIDPVALRGDKWFLGQIYGYPDGGVYFGVPISNFAGWAVVGFIMISVLQETDSLLHRRNVKDWFGFNYPWRFLIGPALYLAVIVFNLCITFYIGEYTIGWAGVFISLPFFFLLYPLMKSKLFPATTDNALEAHRRDFPKARL